MFKNYKDGLTTQQCHSPIVETLDQLDPRIHKKFRTIRNFIQFLRQQTLAQTKQTYTEMTPLMKESQVIHCHNGEINHHADQCTSLVKEQDVLGLMNALYKPQAYFYSIQGKTECFFYTNAQDKSQFSCTHIHFLCQAKQETTLVLHYVAQTMEHPCYENNLTHITVEEGASLHCYQYFHEKEQSVRSNTVYIHQKKDSKVFFHTLVHHSGLFNLQSLRVEMDEGAKYTHVGLLIAQQKEHVNHYLDIAHKGSKSSSEIKSYQIGKDHGMIVIDGETTVHASYKDTQSSQYHHNLLLSPNVSIYSRPQLFIHNDNVVCKHGSTYGNLDQEIVFYLQSRGFKNAKDVIVELFIHQAIDQMPLFKEQDIKISQDLLQYGI